MAFWIKICGITNPNDAHAAAEAGADAIGLNFFNKSRRFIEPHAAKLVVAQLPSHILKVGVFVNYSANQIAEITQQVGLDAVQLHGDERPSLFLQLPTHLRIIRAHRCSASGMAPLALYLDECHALGRMPDMLLIDADAGAAFGGSGRLADWALIRNQKKMLGGLPFLLAGGLTPENIAAAIDAVEPNGVDVASGVESKPGIKDTQLIAQFVTTARNMCARTSP